MARADLRRRIHAVVLAGGAGQRFWPRLRRRRPKPLLSVLGGETLLEDTLQRARRCAPPGQVWIVCGDDLGAAMQRASGLPRGRVLREPRPRNTAMAVGYAAQRIAAEFPDALLAVLPADHRIPDQAAFARAIHRAAPAARDGALVTLGVRPTGPVTGYGYIRLGDEVKKPHKGLHRVRSFVEKPGEAQARRYLRQGHLWNAGVFIWSAAAILEEIEEHAPRVHRALAAVRRTPRGSGARAALEAAYARAPSLPIDVAVLERSQRVWTLPVGFHWSDLGTWASLAKEAGVGPGTSRVLSGEAVEEDATGNLVCGGGRLIALLGVQGLAVIDTPDALLIASIEKSPDVRRIVERLESRGRKDLT